ncbi:MAG: tRNA lysidine(34) synthetase TilS [Vicinamibacterales bacterium]
MSLVDRVQAFAGRHGLWTPETGVVAAVSGGSDSVALLFILDALARAGRLRIAGVAHLHHHIRGAEADGDAAFVEALAARLGLPLDLGHVDVPARARASGCSAELAGRQARLEFLRQSLGRLGGDVVALAHTRGDQAETVLLRLVRGAGPRGLGGMAPRADHRVRPLLDIGRRELRAWLDTRGEAWREDATNDDVGVARNRIRHEVLPRLALLNTRVEEALARAARIHAADARLLDQLAAAEADRLVAREGPTRVQLNLDALARLPEALARRVVLQTLETLDPSRAYGWEETNAVLDPGPKAPVREIGPIRLERIRGFAVLTSRGARAPHPPTRPDEAAVPLEVPGAAHHPLGHWVVEAAGPMSRELAGTASTHRAVLDADAIGRRLTVRGWRPGDRVEPLGLGGHKKVQDVFVDRKVPRGERGLVPIVLDGEGRIAWVAGHVVGEAFRVTPRSAAVVVLTLRR